MKLFEHLKREFCVKKMMRKYQVCSLRFIKGVEFYGGLRWSFARSAFLLLLLLFLLLSFLVHLLHLTFHLAFLSFLFSSH